MLEFLDYQKMDTKNTYGRVLGSSSHTKQAYGEDNDQLLVLFAKSLYLNWQFSP